MSSPADGTAGSPAVGRPTELVLRNGVALLGDDLQEQAFSTVLVRDGVIAEIHPAREPGDVDEDDSPEPAAGTGPDRQVLDLDGSYLLPGLVDAHVHFDLAAHPAAFDHWERDPLVRSLTCFANGLRALRAGITSVRDLGSVDQLTLAYGRQVASGRVPGPQVLAAGRPITMTGGHCCAYGRVADGAEQVRLAVREQLAAGAGVIKLMATGGISSPGNPGLPQLGVAELAAGVVEAHQAGVLVAAHAHAPQGIANAIEAGVDTIEHAAFGDAESHLRMIDAGVTLVPTVVALSPIAPGVGIPAATVRKSVQARDTYQVNTGRAIAAGVRIAAGTDAGTALNPIGGLLDELLLYVELGMSPADALRSATVTAGSLIGGPARTGVLAVGARADLLVVDRDPRVDLDVLRRPRGVVVAGRSTDLGWVEQTLAEVAEVTREPGE